jgi:hypothetical protein
MKSEVSFLFHPDNVLDLIPTLRDLNYGRRYEYEPNQEVWFIDFDATIHNAKLLNQTISETWNMLVQNGHGNWDAYDGEGNEWYMCPVRHSGTWKLGWEISKMKAIALLADRAKEIRANVQGNYFNFIEELEDAKALYPKYIKALQIAPLLDQAEWNAEIGKLQLRSVIDLSR